MQNPFITVTCSFLTFFRNSFTSLVFPAPASPKTNNVAPFPAHAASSDCCSRRSSGSLPTNAGSVSIGDFKPLSTVHPHSTIASFSELNLKHKLRIAWKLQVHYLADENQMVEARGFLIHRAIWFSSLSYLYQKAFKPGHKIENRGQHAKF